MKRLVLGSKGWGAWVETGLISSGFKWLSNLDTIVSNNIGGGLEGQENALQMSRLDSYLRVCSMCNTFTEGAWYTLSTTSLPETRVCHIGELPVVSRPESVIINWSAYEVEKSRPNTSRMLWLTETKPRG